MVFEHDGVKYERFEEIGCEGCCFLTPTWGCRIPRNAPLDCCPKGGPSCQFRILEEKKEEPKPNRKWLISYVYGADSGFGFSNLTSSGDELPSFDELEEYLKTHCEEKGWRDPVIVAVSEIHA